MSIRRGITTGSSALALVALVATSAAAGASRPSTTEPVQIVAVNVSVTDARVKLDHTGVGFDNTVQFRVRNQTRTPRNFIVGDQRVRVPARGNRVLLVFFGIRGKFPYMVTPGTKPGHRGIFRVV